MKKSVVINILICLFIFLFLYTGLMKFLDHDLFISSLRKSPLLKNISLPLSFIIPGVELLTIISLIIPRTQKIGLVGFLVLMSIFTIYVGFMLYFQSDLPCTCGGVISQMNWHQHLYFNSFFTVLAVIALLLNKQIQKKAEKQTSVSYTS